MTSPEYRTRAPAAPYDLASAAHDYPDWSGPPTRTILVCAHPRSGSTLLGEAIYFAGGLGCPLEYFHAGFRPSFARRWQAPDLASLSAAVRRHRTAPGGTMAVKLFWRDLEDIAGEIDPGFRSAGPIAPADAGPDYYAALARHITQLFPNPVFVHLWREDRLRQAISGIIATETNRWRLIPGTAAAPEADSAPPDATPAAGDPIAFDVERIERMIAFSDYCHGHFRNLFAAMGVAPFGLSYEALTRDYAASVGRVLAHLGSASPAMAPRMRRQSDAASEALVLRYLRERADPIAMSARAWP